jgi:hypothetical protein
MQHDTILECKYASSFENEGMNICSRNSSIIYVSLGMVASLICANPYFPIRVHGQKIEMQMAHIH